MTTEQQKKVIDAFKKLEDAFFAVTEAVEHFEYSTGENLPIEEYPFTVDLDEQAHKVLHYRERLFKV